MKFTYIDPRRLSLDNGRLKENVFIDKAEVVVQLGDCSREHPLRRLAGALEKTEERKWWLGEEKGTAAKGCMAGEARAVGTTRGRPMNETLGPRQCRLNGALEGKGN